MRADMLSNKNFNQVTEYFTRGRKLKLFLVFIIQYYFTAPKNIRLNSTHYYTVKIRKKRKL